MSLIFVFRHRLPIPIILNKAISSFDEYKEDNAKVEIEVFLDPQVMFTENIAFGIFQSIKLPVREIMNEILNRKRISLEAFQEDLERTLKPPNEQYAISTKVSLLSPFTGQRIMVPFRGKNCLHITPDELESYITCNESHEFWLCRICRSTCTPDDIMIDE